MLLLSCNLTLCLSVHLTVSTVCGILVGMLDARHAVKGQAEVGMVVCKIGGPAYRIGLGGGAASSRSHGTVESALDFNAVQRGDAEMENRMNRFVRACVELGEGNPIVSIHDQVRGATRRLFIAYTDCMCGNGFAW